MADSNNNGGIDSNDILSIVALVVSLIALLGTIAQVLQQYYASAAGYSNCDEKVMGRWHEKKQRIFRATELRFEVQFETPVIFVSPPTNERGPVKGAPIHYLNGTPESLKETRILLPTADKKEQEALVSRAKHVHTADNERATWVTMLSELQSMENESQKWQRDQYGSNPPNGQPQAQFSDHTLAVAIQSKRRSWDTMPSTVKKPYATTTICHLIEIVAMLGLHWKEFDRSTDRYRAEGNGYMLTGSKVNDLGIMFTFQIYGKSRFRENRVIPVDEIKELCFGYFSTIFRKDTDGRRLDSPDEEPSDLSILQVGSTNDMAEALVLLGCNTNTANYFRSETAKHSHLFPVVFELVGMLGKNLHIPNSCYRMLPNPTPYHWDKKFFSLRKLLQEYEGKIKNDDLVVSQTGQIQKLCILSEKVIEQLKVTPEDFSTPLLDSLHKAIGSCDTFLRGHADRKLVTMVLREHFQEVLRMINDTDAADDGAAAVAPTPTTAMVPSISPTSPAGLSANGLRPPRFDDLNAASPEEKQETFMDIYFTVVLPRVVRQAVDALQRRRSTMNGITQHGRNPSMGSAYSPHPSPIEPAPRPPAAPTPQRSHSNGQNLRVTVNTGVEIQDLGGGDSNIGVERLSRSRDQRDQRNLESDASDIWCTLVFRMLCWLLVHDFHKRDVQISKSELLGSRLPVYIA